MYISFPESDCILHGYIKKLGGPFASAWQTRYAKLYPNRLELHLENSAKPEMILLDTVEEVSSDFVSIKGEQCIVLRTRNDTKIVLTNTVCVIYSYWGLSMFLNVKNLIGKMLISVMVTKKLDVSFIVHSF